VANELESLVRENEALRDKTALLEKERDGFSREIEIFRDNEKTFQKAIVKSQDLAEDVIENATKRAELITKEAEILASKTRLQVHEEILNLNQELEELRMKNEAIIDDVKNYLIEKLNSIEEYSKNRKIFRLEHNISDINESSSDKDEHHGEFGMDLNIDESK
jgi:cell division septum initiation protein DivIVA